MDKPCFYYSLKNEIPKLELFSIQLYNEVNYLVYDYLAFQHISKTIELDDHFFDIQCILLTPSTPLNQWIKVHLQSFPFIMVQIFQIN